MKKDVKIGFISLGCPKNVIDCERMMAMVANAGYTIVTEDIDADVMIVNTCGFIEAAKRESIDSILDVAWLKKNRHLKAIIVTGCMAERYGAEVFDSLPEVDALLGVGSFDRITEAVEAVLKGEKYSSFEDKNTSLICGERILSTPEYSGYLKIAEGCDNRCTYCSIPDIRGRFRSRTEESIVEEAVTLEASGVKELILVAQDDTRYGLDLYGEYRLPSLIRKICDATSIPWIRLLYCYPDRITDELIKELAENPRLLKYIDLPIQHISESVLKRMHRRGGAEAVRSAVARLRGGVPGITIRSTVITGFPGETDEEFAELLGFIKEARFERLGAFTYSQEENTPAAEMPDQIDEQTKSDRYDAIMSAQLEITAEANAKKIGTVQNVLCEGYDPVAETYYGRSEADAPDIDGKVYFQSPGRKVKEGEFVRIRVGESLDYDLVGVVEKD